MAKLPSALAKQAAETDGQAFSAIAPGIYTGRLAKVEVTKSSNDNPMWKLEFDDIRNEDGDKMPGRQFSNLVLMDTTAWKVSQFFDAFGAPTDTDTDDLLGERIRLEIVVRTIEKGKREGQKGNNIDSFLPLQPGDSGYSANAAANTEGGTKPAKAAAAKAPANAAAEF